VSQMRMSEKFKILKSCSISEDILFEFVEGELSREFAQDLSLHIETCGTCTEQVGQFKGLKSSFQEPLPSEDFFAALENKIMTRIEKSVREPQTVERETKSKAWFWVPSVAAAALVILVFGALFKTSPIGQEGTVRSQQAALEEQLILKTASQDPSFAQEAMLNQNSDDLVLTAAAEKLSRMSEGDARAIMEKLK
jgi:anti-sigma factor RsiW